MVLHYFVRHGWPAIGMWVVCYWADYRLTLVGARLAREAQHTVSSPGSYELTPEYRADIGTGRRHSWTFYRSVIVGALAMAALSVFTVALEEGRLAFEVLFGAMLVPEIEVLVRHVMSITSLHYVARREGVSGVLHYSTWYSMRVSAIELLSHGAVWAVIFALTARWFFLGGSIGLLNHGGRQWARSMHESKATGAPEPRGIVAPADDVPAADV